jgi:AcrR family transcriptional regulator
VPGPERRALILGAAREAFAREGFHGAGTAAIARAAGCSEAVLYRHFPSKKALLLAALQEELRGRLESGRALVPPAGADPAVGLPETLDARLRDPEMTTTIRLILLAIAMTGDPEVRDVVVSAFGTIRAPLRAALEAGQEGGSVRADLDPELLTWLWHGLFLVAALRNGIRDDGTALEAVEAARILAEMTAPGRP